MFCRFTPHDRPLIYEMAFNHRDIFWRNPHGGRGRTARQKDQEIPNHNANADTSAKTAETVGQKTDPYSNSHGFVKSKEGFANSVSERDAEEQIEAQESEPIADTRGGRNAIAKPRGNSYTVASAAFRSWKKRRTQRQSFTG